MNLSMQITSKVRGETLSIVVVCAFDTVDYDDSIHVYFLRLFFLSIIL